MTGATTEMDYDGFGRMTDMYRPDGASLGANRSAAALHVDYQLGSPISVLRSYTQDGRDPLHLDDS